MKIATNGQLETTYAGLGGTNGRYKFSMGQSDPATNSVEFILDISGENTIVYYLLFCLDWIELTAKSTSYWPVKMFCC